MEIPSALDGYALQDYFRDPAFGSDRSVQRYGIIRFRMIRRNHYKYFRGHGGEEEMLFDSSTDPGELKNRASDPELRDLKAALAREMDRILEKPPPDLAPVTSGAAA